MEENEQTRFAEAVWAAFLEEARDLLMRVESGIGALPAAETDGSQAPWQELKRSLHTLKGAAAAAGEAEVKTRVHALEERVGRLHRGEEALDAAVLDALYAEVERIHERIFESAPAAILARPEAPEAEPAETGPARAAPASEPGGAGPSRGNGSDRAGSGEVLRVGADRVDALHTLVGELVVATLRQERLAGQVVAVRDRMAECQRAWKQLADQLQADRRGDGARLSDALRTRLRGFSEKLTAATKAAFETAREAPNVQAQTLAIMDELGERVAELRLMPLKPFFEEHARVVRQAGRESGKEVRLEIHADGAEVDRPVLMRMREPLLHLVRNAVVHGIEPGPRRRELGKSEVGTVRLVASCSGTRAVIRVEDDGAGVDLDAVRGRAQELGLLEERGAVLSEERVLQLLTEPGFTTRRTADGLAGRGVGLDVVASTVQGLGGRLGLETAPGRGTTFVVELPVTAATGVGLVIEAAGRRFGVLTTPVERILRVARTHLEELQGHAVLDVGEERLAVASLAALLGIEGDEDEDWEKRPALLLRLGTQGLVLLVDAIHEEQVMVIRSLPGPFADARVFVGAAIQPDGSVLPVLQAPELLARMGALDHRVRLASDGPRPAEDGPVVLVVEDSLTMRSLERNILQGAGYRVQIAHDGVSALEELERMEACHLIVSDYQMPRMDGIDLCRAVRSSQRPNLPFVMVTSVGDAEERRKALEAGADAYLVKADFEQATFLDQVRRLAGPGLA